MRYTGIIDGSYLLHRILKAGDFAYLKSTMGEPTGGVIGSLRNLRGTLGAFEIGSLIFAWDSFGYSRRRLEMFPDYKCSRGVDESDKESVEYMELFKDQRSKLFRVLDSLGIPSVAVPNHEGDDVVGYLSTKVIDGPCLIISDDKDYLQLVSDRVHIWKPIKNVLVTLDNFKQVTGLDTPEKLLLYMAITGDDGDDIPGIPGVGDTTATQYAENMQKVSYAEVDRVCQQFNRSKRHQLVLDNLKIVIRNYHLIDLSKEDFDLTEHAQVLAALDRCKYQVNDLEFMKHCKSLEFESITKQFASWIQPFKFLAKPAIRGRNVTAQCVG